MIAAVVDAILAGGLVDVQPNGCWTWRGGKRGQGRWAKDVAALAVDRRVVEVAGNRP